MNQGELFKKPAKVTVPCAQCGREIVLSQRRGKTIYSERQDRNGLCWGCSLDAQVKRSKEKSL